MTEETKEDDKWELYHAVYTGFARLREGGGAHFYMLMVDGVPTGNSFGWKQNIPKSSPLPGAIYEFKRSKADPTKTNGSYYRYVDQYEGPEVVGWQATHSAELLLLAAGKREKKDTHENRFLRTLDQARAAYWNAAPNQRKAILLLIIQHITGPK